MIVSFRNDATADIFDGTRSAKARRLLPVNLWAIAARKLDQLNHVTEIEDLNIPPGNRLAALSGDREGQYSIRINNQFRICFQWTSDGPAYVEVVDYH